MAELGKYQLGARLGGGGMAEVFTASTVGSDGFVRSVAIKRVLPELAGDLQFVELFMAEARIGARLAHPNIVSVIDFDHDAAGDLFIVMELVEGCDLATLAAAGLLPFPVVIHVIAEVLRGLGYAHNLPGGGPVRGVVHRDMSPHNVLLSWQGAVKVTDFGIAKAREATQASASLYIKGKPAYMSPEQASGQALDGRSDLFAVGVILWELLVGRQLFLAEDMRGTLAAVLFGTVPAPRKLRREVPKDLERVVMKLLERDLSARYPSAEAALAELLACVDAPRDSQAELSQVLAEFRASAVRARAVATVAGDRRRNTAVGEVATVVGSRGRVLSEPTKRRMPVLAVVLVLATFGGGPLAYVLLSSRERHAASVVSMAPLDAAAPRDSLVRRPPRPVVDLNELGPECAAYTRLLERIVACQTLSQAARDAYVGVLKAWRESLPDVRDYPVRSDMEKTCKQGAGIVQAGAPGC